MGIIKKAFNTKSAPNLGKSISEINVSTMAGGGGDKINVIDEYNGFAWKCINLRSETLADQRLYIQKIVGDKLQDDDNHPFNQVLEGADGDYDLYETLEAHAVSMDLYGESFWYFTSGELTKKPISRMLLNPNNMQVIVKDGRVEGYIYNDSGSRIPLDTSEIAHFKIYNPANPFRGAGPMQKAGWFVRSARYTYTYVNNFLENNAIPAGVIVATDDVNDDDWRLFKQSWQEKHAGIDSAGKTGFVRGGLEFVKTGLSLGEVDFEKMKNSSRNDVMAMFGISGALMGIFEDINRASSVTARQLFATSYVSPALKRLTSKLTKKVAKWYGEQYILASNNPVPDDRELTLDEFHKGINRWFTPNEIREAYGYKPIDGGDELVIEEDSKLDINKPNAPVKLLKVKTKGNKTQYSYEMKESFRAESEQIQDEFDLKTYEALEPLLIEQKKMVVDQLKPKKLASANFDTVKETERLAKGLLPIFLDLAKKQGAVALLFAGSSSSFNVDAIVATYVKNSITKALAGFNEETLTAISKTISEGVANGDSVARLSKRIDDIYSEMIGAKQEAWRTARLTRTEVAKTASEITEAAYIQSEVVNKKEWFANPGHCEYCAALNGSIVQLGTEYASIGQDISGIDPKTKKPTGNTFKVSYESIKHPPAHPQCRCALVPFIEEL